MNNDFYLNQQSMQCQFQEESLYEQNQIYYYSRFQLFTSESQKQFYQYILFLRKVQKQLGYDWKQEATKICFPIISSNDIFMVLLEIWLHRREGEGGFHLNWMQSHSHNNPFHTRAANTVSKHYQDDIQEFGNRIQAIAGDSQMKQASTLSIKAVCMGFFMTSEEIWEEMFQEKTTTTPPKPGNLFTANSLIKGVTAKVTTTIERTLKPLMVVTQKIGSVLGDKRRKLNQHHEEEYQKVERHQQFEGCYQEFKRSLDLEKEIVRKLSECSLNSRDEEMMDESYEREEMKVLEKKEFTMEDSPVSESRVSTVYNQVTNFLNKAYPWQVASNFVTNILDLTHCSRDSSLQVKVLRPAQDFYHRLILVWILFHSEEFSSKLSFDLYLKHVRMAVGKRWKQEYVGPTRYFWERINNDMKVMMESKEGSESVKGDKGMGIDQEKPFMELLERVRAKMENQWERRIKCKRGTETKCRREAKIY